MKMNVERLRRVLLFVTAVLLISPARGQGNTMHVSEPVGHVIGFQNSGKIKVKGPTGEPWERPYALINGTYGGSSISADSPNSPEAAGHGWVECSGPIEAYITFDAPDGILPPAVIIEETISVSWSGGSGSCSHDLTDTFDEQVTNGPTGGSKSAKRLRFIKNPGRQLTFSVNAEAKAQLPEGWTPPPGSRAATPIWARAGVGYSVRVLAPFVTGTNQQIVYEALRSYVPQNIQTAEWKVGGVTVASWTAGQMAPSRVRYDSTHFDHLTPIWSELSGTTTDGKNWKHKDVWIAYNAFGVRTADEFENGQWIEGKRKFGKQVHATIVGILAGVNHENIGDSVSFSVTQFESDISLATVHHVSAHGTPTNFLADAGGNRPIYSVNFQRGFEKRAKRGLSNVGFNIVFLASCSTGTPDSLSVTHTPRTAANYGIGGPGTAFCGFNQIIYIAGSQAAAVSFWSQLVQGVTVSDAIPDAMQAYDAELDAVATDSDLAPYLLQSRDSVRLVVIGDGSAKLHGLYNPGVFQQQPLPRLTWLVVEDYQGNVVRYY